MVQIQMRNIMQLIDLFQSWLFRKVSYIYMTKKYNSNFNDSLGNRGEEIIDLLIENGSNVRRKNTLKSLKLKILTKVHFFFFQINETFQDGQTPLHKAILSSHKKAIELLILKRDANVNVREKRLNMTPLHYMAIVDSHSFRGRGHWSEDDRISEIC